MDPAVRAHRSPTVSGINGTFELSWELFGELSRALAVRASQEYTPDLVIGIATAGVLPAATIAAILQVEFASLKVTRRLPSGEMAARPEVRSPSPVEARGRRVLLVDELSTSGETMRLALAAIREVGPRAVKTAAAFVRPGGYRPDFFALETDALIVFPWDRQVIGDGELVTHPTYSLIAER